MGYKETPSLFLFYKHIIYLPRNEGVPVLPYERKNFYRSGRDITVHPCIRYQFKTGIISTKEGRKQDERPREESIVR